MFISQSQVSSQAPLVYASASQINFQVPSRLVAGTAQMYVTVGGGQSLVFNFTVVSASPGFFQNTSNHAVAQNADHSANSSSKPAAVGSVVSVYLTGQGPVDHPVADGKAAGSSPLSNATDKVSATIGGMAATVQFLGLAPGFVGLAQANIEVPKLATGDYPMVITVGGFVSASAVLSVSGSGTAPPTFLTQVGRVNFGNTGMSNLVVFGNITYVCGANRINIIDTSDVTKPIYDGEFGDADLHGNGGKCALNLDTSTPILVVLLGPGSTPSFVVYNVGSPRQPVLIGSIAPQSYTFLADLVFVGTLGFSSTSWFTFNSANDVTNQYGDFLAFDFSALLPQLVSFLAPVSNVPSSNNLNPKPNALELLPFNLRLVYVATTTNTGNFTTGNAALDVIDVSNVQSLQGIDRVTVPNSTIFLGMAYDNSLLLVTGNTTGYRNPGVPDFNLTGTLTLTTMDISNVRSPQTITTVVTNVQTTGTYSVEPLGSKSYVYALVNNPPETDPAGPSSLMVVDARTSKSPVLYPVITQFGLNGIAASNGFLLAPDENGMTIYKFAIPQ